MPGGPADEGLCSPAGGVISISSIGQKKPYVQQLAAPSVQAAQGMGAKPHSCALGFAPEVVLGCTAMTSVCTADLSGFGSS